ncbi:MAG: PaaI family thioesterase [Pseudomonadota bacterium]
MVPAEPPARPPLPAPRDPAWADRVAAGFAAQPFMAHLGARLGPIAPGRVEIELPITAALGQQHGFVHAGCAWSIADSAAGFAAQSLMAATDGVLTVELKINLLAPAEGTLLRAIGQVERAGRRLTVARSDVFAERDHGHGEGNAPRHVATALGTFMSIPESGMSRR